VTDPRSDIAQPAAELPLPVNIPYGFAKRFGVALLGEEDGRPSSPCAKAGTRAR
jgi:hypothetical protein